MTAHKHLKQLVRARMEKTGERYAAARRQIISTPDADREHPHAPSHFPGNIPATTALRVLLADAGVRAPHTGKPFTEAMLFGIAGGIGIGLFSFYYQKEDVASFFIAGRHQWHDDLGYLRGALKALDLQPEVRETSGKKAAARQLAEAVADRRPCIAWVDMASLPHRGMPASLAGMTYHVVAIYDVDAKNDVVLLGDLTDHPVPIALADLEGARARIAKQKFRLLSLPRSGAAPSDLRALVADGLRRCHHGFLHPTLPQAQNNARLEVLQTWAGRLGGSKDPQSWQRVFRRGLNLWRGLNWVHDFIENYGTGGGLSRPLFADFLEEAAAAVSWPGLRELAGRYRELGRCWSDLADAALPDSVPAFRQAKELRWQRAELRHDGAEPAEIREMWAKLDQVGKEIAADFPLSEKGVTELLADLQARVLSLYEGETAALAEIGKLGGTVR